MSWTDSDSEWDDQAPAETQAEEPADEAGAESDPLAAFDEDQRQAIATLLTQREQEAEARAQAEADKRYRSSMGKWGQAAKNLSNIGLIVDDHGNVAPQDPQKLAEVAARYGTKAAPPEPKADEEALPADFAYLEPAEQQRVLSRITEKAAKAAVSGMEQRLDALMGLVSRQQMPSAAVAAKPFLANLGLSEDLSEAPEFREAFEQALNGIPLEMRGDPQSAKLAASMALAMLPDEVMTTKRQQSTRPDPAAQRQAVAQANRAGLAQSGASRGSAPGASRDPQYSDEERAMAQLLGWDPKEVRIYSDRPTYDSSGRSAAYDHLDKAAGRKGS